MAVPKSSNISKTGMQYSSCPSISWNYLEVLTFHRPVMKNDKKQLINLILGHPPLSTLGFGCNEPGFGTLAWKEQPFPGHLLHNKVSVPPVLFETWLVSRTRPACTLHQHSWQLPHTSLLLLPWKISAGSPPLAFCTALKPSNILHHVLSQHKRKDLSCLQDTTPWPCLSNSKRYKLLLIKHQYKTSKQNKILKNLHQNPNPMVMYLQVIFTPGMKSALRNDCENQVSKVGLLVSQWQDT